MVQQNYFQILVQNFRSLRKIVWLSETNIAEVN